MPVMSPEALRLEKRKPVSASAGVGGVRGQRPRHHLQPWIERQRRYCLVQGCRVRRLPDAKIRPPTRLAPQPAYDACRRQLLGAPAFRRDQIRLLPWVAIGWKIDLYFDQKFHLWSPPAE